MHLEANVGRIAVCAEAFRTLVRRGLATAAEYERFVADLSITGYVYVGWRRAR